MPEIVAIPVELIMPNPDQPRRYISPASIQRMANSLKELGQRTEVKLRPLTDEEKVRFAPVEYMLIGGERRWRGAKLAGLPTLKAIVLNLTPEEAEQEAYTDNQRDDMTWFEKDLYIARRSQRTGLSVRQLAEQMEVSKTKVHEAITIASVLTPGSTALIDELLKSEASDDESVRPTDTQNKGFSLTRSLLLTLARLEASETVEKALKAACDNLMTEAEAKKLVAWVQAGNPTETYSNKPASKAPKPIHEVPSQAEPQPATAPAHHTSGSAYSEPTPGSATEPEQPNHASRLVGSRQAHPAHLAQTGSVSPSGISAPKGPQSAVSMNTAEQVAYDALAGVSVIAKIKTKLKKGEKPTTAETLLLAGHALWTALHFLSKHGFKLVKLFLKETWKLSKDGLKVLAKTWIGTIFKYAFAIFVIWFGVTAYMFGISYPLTAIGTFAVHHLKWKASSSPVEVTPQTQPASASNADSSSNVESAQPNLVARPVVSQQAPQDAKPAVASKPRVVAQASSYIPTHALSEDEEDPKQFEAELAALPNNARISDYAVVPDNTMAGDMAYRRLTDLSNSDKYAMKIGGGTQKVLNVQVSTTNLTINYQNDINSLFGGSLKMDFYWEDVKAAHCDLITPFEANKKPFYQLTVLVNDAKHPLIVQCAKALDMQRLVSALDNYLRAARLQPLALGGLPYPLQGLRLNDKNEVTLLWADSPAGKAGVAVKDILWSFEKNLANPVENKLLQAQLHTLSPGTHALYLVKPADWSKAQIAQSMGQANRFNPKRQMMSLVVP